MIKIRLILLILSLSIVLHVDAQGLYNLGKTVVASAKAVNENKKESKKNKEAERANVDFSDVYNTAKGKVKKKEYKNGDYYVGEWSKGKPHGYGKMLYANKTIYSGNWDLGNIQGYGTVELADGSKYTGYWLNNKFHGKGKVMLPNGDWYDGQWTLGEIDGNGKVYLASQKVTFDGTFKCEIQNDKILFKPLSGKYSSPTILFQEGTWEPGPSYSWDYGTFNGTYQTAALIFTGSMNGNSFVNGELVYKTKDKGSHKGLFKNNQIYEGVSDGVIDNTYLSSGPAKYIGTWKDGKFYGNFEGKAYGPDTKAFALKADKDGSISGKVQRSDGGIYSGFFRANKLNGEGSLSYPEHEYSGLWKDGEWIAGTAILNKDSSHPIRMVRDHSNLIVEDAQSKLSGTYSMAAIDYKNPLPQIEEQHEAMVLEEEIQKARHNAIKEIDSKLARMVFIGEGSILTLGDNVGAALVGALFGSMATQNLVVTFLPGGKVNIREVNSNVASSDPYRLSDAQLFAAAMNSSKGITGEVYLIDNKLVIDENLYIKVAPDKRYIEVYGANAAYRLYRKK